MPQLYLLSEEDRDLLRQVIAENRGRVVNKNRRLAPPAPLLGVPEVLLCQAPSGGIAATVSGPHSETGTGTGTAPGQEKVHSAECEVFRLLPARAGHTSAFEPQNFTQDVWNTTTTAIPAYSWIIAVKDRWGQWCAVWSSEEGGGSISIDASNGVIVSPDPITGTGTVSGVDASRSNVGVVNLTSQALGTGTKRVDSLVAIGIASSLGVGAGSLVGIPGPITIATDDTLAHQFNVAYVFFGTGQSSTFFSADGGQFQWETDNDSLGTGNNVFNIDGARAQFSVGGIGGLTGTVGFGATAKGGLINSLGSSATHLQTGGSSPSVGSLGSGVTSGSATGTDSATQVTLAASVSITVGKVCTVTFSSAFSNAPVVVCSIDGTNTALTVTAYPANVSTTTFDIYVAGLSGVVTGLVINCIAVGAPN